MIKKIALGLLMVLSLFIVMKPQSANAEEIEQRSITSEDITLYNLSNYQMYNGTTTLVLKPYEYIYVEDIVKLSNQWKSVYASATSSTAPIYILKTSDNSTMLCLQPYKSLQTGRFEIIESSQQLTMNNTPQFSIEYISVGARIDLKISTTRTLAFTIQSVGQWAESFVIYDALYIGHSDGFSQGYDTGYNQGLEEAPQSSFNNGYEEGYQSGLQDGLQDGYDEGHYDGYDEGYDTGYNVGYGEGIETADNDFYALFTGIADTPFMILYSLLSFEVFGFSLYQVLFSILTILVIIWVIRKFMI